MELSQLRTIIHVAELGSLSKAADRLRIAQPALSRQVRMLEEELGVRLFERHGRGMVISEAGQDVLRHAYRIAAEIQEIRSDVADANVSLKGHVSVGMPPTVSDVLAAPLVSAIQAQHPDATIRIVSAYTSYILEWIHKGEIDVAILFENKNARSLKSEVLLEESLHLIGPAECDLSPDIPVEFSALSQMTLLLPSAGHSLRNLLDEHLRGSGIELNVTVETDSYSTLKNLVRAGNGTSVLPLASIHDELTTGRLKHAPIINPLPKRRLMISVPSDRPATRIAKFAYDALKDSTASLVKSGVWPAKMVS